MQKSRASVGDDIKKPGVTEWGYDALPIKGVAQLYKYLKLARKRLPGVKTPVLLFLKPSNHPKLLFNFVDCLQEPAAFPE